jgi:diacylglycerol kinase
VAFKGLAYAIRTQGHLKVHLAAALAVCVAGAYYQLAVWEWVAVVGCIGMVGTTELLNTAIERWVDAQQPDYDPQAGLVKDVAAGAVLWAALCAAIVGLMIFVPKILALLY